MKLASKSLFIAAASAAALLSGCAKKPVRPEPSATALGPTAGGGASLQPETIPTTADTGSQLQQRDGVIDDGKTIRGLLQPVYFDLNMDNIKAAERPKLQAAKDYLDKNPQYRILLEGHCDWRGTSEYNLSLGDHRANSAKKYLIKLGVPADKIETLSKGSEEAAKNADEATMAKDRRDEVVVLKS
jgi:peptidoglycan-associated lipoprotein